GLRKEVLGEKHPDHAQSLNNLAGLYMEQGDCAKAEPLFRQALETYQQVLGEKHPRCAVSLNNLAVLYRLQGDDARAPPLARQAVAIMRDHLDLAAAGQSERQQLRMTESLRHHLDGYLSVAQAARLPGRNACEMVLSWKGAVTARQQRLRLERRDPGMA